MTLPGTLPIKVLLIDDHLSMLWGLERLIQSSKEPMEVFGKATCGAEAMALLGPSAPDIVLLDLDLGKESGLLLMPQLCARTSGKILVLTGLRDKAVHDQAMLAGACGVLQKEASGETILNAIARVHEGQIWLDRASTRRLFMESVQRNVSPAVNPEEKKISSLTERERRIAALSTLHAGDPAKVIAARLGISEHTLRNHLTAIYKKLNVTNRLELLSYAQKQGLDKLE